MRHNLGIMQGRLTEPKGRGIQFFPFDHLREEFDLVKEIRLDEIEFIFDYDNYEQNPLWQDAGERVKEAASLTGVNVHSVCFDYFMRRPFFKFDGAKREEVLEENKRIIDHILCNMKKTEIKLIEIPLVDDSSLKSEREAEAFRGFLL